jgi:DNA-binding IclR family transcriptional regulator
LAEKQPKTKIAKKEQSSPRKGIQVIARAASVLRALENEPDGLSLGKIAQRVDLSRSTVQRIVDALTEEHLLIGASPTSGVKLGPAILRMASNSSFDFVEFIRPYIKQLSRETGETVDISAMQKTRTVFVDQVVGSARLNIISPIGEAFPLHCLASGKAMLATLSDTDLVKRLGQNPLERQTSNTIASLDVLIAELAKVRKTHISYDREEHIEGVSAVGTSIQEPAGKLYAISIPVPTVRFAKKQKLLVEALLNCRSQILEEIGV